MSAIKTGSEPVHDDWTSHHFEQKIPMPSYLIAIAVGALQSRKIGPRSHVWTEKEMIEESAYEFAETEKMLSVAEELMGPYEWGVYDLLVLPPSFPYGGMENPCLTFITPTLLAGDRSLALVVAHEIAHSWTGNLITNKNPEHFWLNEGHTVFVERKIAGRMQDEKFRHMLALGGWNSLKLEIGNINPLYTVLVPDLAGVDPDDAFSIVPYEKGSALLMFLEERLGGPAAFEHFLMVYVNELKFKSIVTDDWKKFLYKFFSNKKSVLDEIDWDAWFHSSGMPAAKPKYDTSLADAFTALATRWSQCNNDEDLGQFTAADIKSFSPYQVKDFLGVLLEQPALSPAAINRMAEVYGLSTVKNCDIKFRWIRLCLRARIESIIPNALEFVSSQGRLKYVRPVYRDLYNWEVSRQRTLNNYESTKSQMHPLTATMISKDLQLLK
jgi:leukotriene-A4 hydrolase